MYHSITCIQTGTGQDIIQHMKLGTEGLFVAVQDTLKFQWSVSVSVIILKHNVYFH